MKNITSVIILLTWNLVYVLGVSIFTSCVSGSQKAHVQKSNILLTFTLDDKFPSCIIPMWGS